MPASRGALVPPDQHVLIVAVLLALLAAAVWLERTRAGRLLPGPAVMVIGAFALANLGVLPHSAPAYGQVIRLAVPVGVFLLLLRADLRRIFRETGSLLSLYLVGTLGSVLGILVAWAVLPVPEPAQIAGIQLANLVGGTVNVVAVAHAVGMDASRFTAMMAGAAVVMNLYMVMVGAAHGSRHVQRLLPERDRSAATGGGAEAAGEGAPRARIDGLHLAGHLALAVGVYAVLDLALSAAGRPELLIIAMSIAALGVANLAAPLVERSAGDREIGTLLMYLFFGALGVGVDLAHFGVEAALIAAFILLAILVHLAVLMVAGRLMRASASEVLVASMAGVGGPTTAAAFAASFRRPALITPGVLCGLLGFASATFVGLGLYGLLAG